LNGKRANGGKGRNTYGANESNAKSIRLDEVMMNVEHTHALGQSSAQEQWSALHDGQLSHEQALALVRASLSDDSLMQQWRSMSAIGQVMREEGSVHTSGGAPLVASPVASPRVQSQAVAPTAPAANDSRWKMVAGVAALAAVGSLVWGLLGSGAGVPQGAVLANNTSSSNTGISLVQAPAQPTAATGASTVQIGGQEATMIRNPRLDEFLAAHRQFGGVSALQQPAGSLRSVSVAAPQR
jgi:sigma-E factor negative regulatory protein RseA